MPKNTLDVGKLRQRTPTDVLKDFSRHQEELEKLCESAESPPVKDWTDPKSISSLSGETLADCMYSASRMYGHYRALESATGQLQKGISKSLDILAASLRQGIYKNLEKDVQKDRVLLDPQYQQARAIVTALSYLLGNVEGESRRWHRLAEAFSRDFERRKEETPRTPKKNYPKPPPGLGINPKK